MHSNTVGDHGRLVYLRRVVGHHPNFLNQSVFVLIHRLDSTQVLRPSKGCYPRRYSIETCPLSLSRVKDNLRLSGIQQRVLRDRNLRARLVLIDLDRNPYRSVLSTLFLGRPPRGTNLVRQRVRFEQVAVELVLAVVEQQNLVLLVQHSSDELVD
jgi:hypothetical protein